MIEKAMEPMKLCNDIFITKRADGELGEIYTIDLGAEIGIYQVESVEMSRFSNTVTQLVASFFTASVQRRENG